MSETDADTAVTIDVPTVVPLKRPIEMRAKGSDGVIAKIDSLTLRKLEGGDFLDALDAMGPELKVGRLLTVLAASSARITPQQLRQLDPEDLFEVLGKVSDFFPNGLPTGLMGLN